MKLKGHSTTSSGAVGSNFNKSEIVAGMPVAAGEPCKRRWNNPLRLHRNARRLQQFLDRKSSFGNKTPPALDDLPGVHVPPNVNQIEHVETDDLKDFIEKMCPVLTLPLKMDNLL